KPSAPGGLCPRRSGCVIRRCQGNSPGAGTDSPHTFPSKVSGEDMVEYLKTGSNEWTLASGPMADAIVHSTSRMTADDVAAIATYLKDSGTGGTQSRWRRLVSLVRARPRSAHGLVATAFRGTRDPPRARTAVGQSVKLPGRVGFDRHEPRPHLT
ncbi:MAG: hypothetical protein WB586_13360, partial [Chthoniobacterales bacterium]